MMDFAGYLKNTVGRPMFHFLFADNRISSPWRLASQ